LDDSFDVVIVGAGAAGCALANRLTWDPGVRALLLEAGGWDKNPLISIPIGARKLFQHGAYDWGDVSEPDPGLIGRRMAVPHGKVIGGTSSINFMAHTRGHPADYDRWAAQGATGWSYREVLPFFKQCETWERGENAWRGGRGEQGAQEALMTDPLFKAWFAAVRSLGYEITADYNGEKGDGFGLGQFSVRDGQRSSSAKAFLLPALHCRSNLAVVTRAIVTKLLFHGQRVVGLEYFTGGKRREVRGAGRIVLCLGSINTPQLLMLSGIGPADHLRSVGIEPIVDLPVGKNLEDHLGIQLHWTRRQPGPFHQSLRLDRLAFNMLRAYLLHSGPAARLPGAILGFVKSQPTATQPDLELILSAVPGNADFWFPGVKRAYTDGYFIRVQLLSQRSRGELLLRSADPKDRPRIFYNSLSAPSDLETLRHGFKMAWALGNTAELADFRGRLLAPTRELESDAEIDTFIRSTAIQQYHPACTCRMGDDTNAVLDSQLNVRGLEGVSVVDASAMPSLVRAHPTATVIMMAAKAASLWAKGKMIAAPRASDSLMTSALT
jgi:4-pyridoxate dehydrogenase